MFVLKMNTPDTISYYSLVPIIRPVRIADPMGNFLEKIFRDPSKLPNPMRDFLAELPKILEKALC